MSTPSVMAALLAQIEALAAPVKVYDLGNYVDISSLPLNDDAECVLVDFATSSERIASIGAPSSLGFEETGTVAIHWLRPTGFSGSAVLAKAETMRLQLRGKRFGDIIVESSEPFKHATSPIDAAGKFRGIASLLYYSMYSFG
jgi:hypothetical protein